VSAAPGSRPDDARALRAEHDDLARQLARRSSIDEARKAVYAGFAAFIAAGVTVKLAIDRWITERASAVGARPLFFLAALAVTGVVAALAARWALRSRRQMRGEDALYARFRQLRAELGLDR
jgi:hypothetical protein